MQLYSEQNVVEERLLHLWPKWFKLGFAPEPLTYSPHDAFREFPRRGHGRYLQVDPLSDYWRIKDDLFDLIERYPADYDELDLDIPDGEYVYA